MITLALVLHLLAGPAAPGPSRPTPPEARQWPTLPTSPAPARRPSHAVRLSRSAAPSRSSQRTRTSCTSGPRTRRRREGTRSRGPRRWRGDHVHRADRHPVRHVHGHAHPRPLRPAACRRGDAPRRDAGARPRERHLSNGVLPALGWHARHGVRARRRFQRRPERQRARPR